MSTYRWGRTCGGEWGSAPAAIHTGGTAGPAQSGKEGDKWCMTQHYS